MTKAGEEERKIHRRWSEKVEKELNEKVGEYVNREN